MLSALAHRDYEVAYASLDAVLRLEDGRALAYLDMILRTVGDAAARALEDLMRAQGHEYESDLARKYYSQGREEGREEGLREGRIESLRAVLAAHSFVIDEALDRRIDDADVALLDAWIRRAVLAQRLEDIFEG